MGSPMLGYVYGLGCALCWSVAVILFKRSSDLMHPLSFNLFKNFVALLLFAATQLVVNGWTMQLSPSELLIVGVSGFLGIGIADALFVACLKLLGAARTAIIECLYSPCVILISVFALNETLGMLQIIGSLLVISALFIASGIEGGQTNVSSEQVLKGSLLGAVAIGTIAVGITILQPLLKHVDLVEAMTWRILAGFGGSLVILIFYRRRSEIFAEALMAPKKGSLILASFVGTYLTLMLWVAGFKYERASVVAVLNQTSTIFTVLLAAFFLQEKLTLSKCTAALLATGGVILMGWS